MSARRPDRRRVVRRLRVICVDAEPVAGRAFARMLKRAPADVTLALGLRQSRTLLFGPRRATFDLAVIEYFLGGKDRGTSLVSEIRALSPKTAILIVTGAPTRMDEPSIIEHSVVWMPKPVAAGRLRTIVETVVARHRRLLRESPPSPLRMSAAKQAHAREVLAQCRGNRSEAARRLGIGRKTLRRILGKKSPKK